MSIRVVLVKSCMFVVIVALVSVFLASEVRAEIWECVNSAHRGVPIYTNAPVQSNLTNCVRASSLVSVPFNQLSPEAFMGLGAGSTEVKMRARLDEGLGGKARGAKDESIEEPEANSKKRNLFIRWNYKEVRKPGKPFDNKCRIKGSIKDENGGPVRISITRGALTEETFKLIARANYQPTPINITLKGGCRKPGLEVKG